jgi:hypothetical protein
MPKAPLALLLALLLLAAGTLAVLGAVGSASASSGTPYPPLSGTVSGPQYLGVGLKGTYVVHATGGPAEAPNTTIVGVYSYNATLSGPNIQGGFVTPTSGIFVNGTGNLTLMAPANASQTVTISILLRSGLNGLNISDNLSYSITILMPFNVSATLVVASGASVGPLDLTITLDGTPVGTVKVPTLSGGTTYPVSFQYVDANITPGWHTFAISLAQEHGLVTFPGGSQSYSDSFYIPGPPPNYTGWYVAGAAAFVGTIFIWVTRVGARRRGKPKK